MPIVEPICVKEKTELQKQFLLKLLKQNLGECEILAHKYVGYSNVVVVWFFVAMSRLDSECDDDSTSHNERREPVDVLKKTFDEINDRPVDDISLEFFYKPHTISLLLGCIFGMTYIAFTKSNDDQARLSI